MDNNKLDVQEQQQKQREQEQEKLKTRMDGIGKKILILSGKGGVGKSTVAANLAMGLALSDKKVGLLDIDLHGPSIPRILGLEGQRLDIDSQNNIKPVRLYENFAVVSIGFMLTSARDAVIWRGPLKFNVIRQFLADVNWGALDFLVIDSPPGTGDEPLSVAQLAGKNTYAIVVTTPQDVAIADVRRSVAFCETLSIPVMGIVENMSGFMCPHCGKETHLFGTGGGQRLAEEMGVAFLGSIPLEPGIMISGDTGIPYIRNNPQHPAAQTLMHIVQLIINIPSDTVSGAPDLIKKGEE